MPEKEITELLVTIGNYPDGAAIGQLVKQIDVPRRTLQRWVQLLVERKQLEVIGAGRGRRYRATVSDSSPPVHRAPEINSELQPMPYQGALLREGTRSYENRSTSKENLIQISEGAEDIKDYLSKPFHLRKAVGYKADFLEAYIPNKTFYLTDEQMDELMEKGKGSGADHPAGTYLRQVFDRVLIDLSWNSSRLEGNTYSLLETERLLAGGDDETGKSARDRLMILNHKAAIEILADQADIIGFNRYTLLNLHAALAENLLPDEDMCGRIRDSRVGISGSVYHPLNVPQQIEQMFDLFLEKAEAIENPFEQAFFSMVHLPYLQPFEDVNKRTSRLAANIPMVKKNLSPLSFVGVPHADYVRGILGVYEMNRIEYLRDVFLWAYEQSCAHYASVCQEIGDPDPLKFHYRVMIKEAIVHVVRHHMDKLEAARWIAEQAGKEIPEVDRARFVEAAENGLRKLHIGSIARHRIRPAEFQEWQKTWR
ncbi:MAG: Fic family protein [Akkermansiaceae bacterium]